MKSTLTNEQIDRYSRHIILKQVGGKGQEKILQSKVLVIGTGGLGAPAAMYLAAAGVGTIGLVDADLNPRGLGLDRVLRDIQDVEGEFLHSHPSFHRDKQCSPARVENEKWKVESGGVPSGRIEFIFHFAK